jgi:hypothetical protein
MAIGSANEVSSQLYVALDQGYIDDRQFRQLTGLAQESANLVGGLARYLRTTELKGSKYASSATRKRAAQNREPRTQNQEPRTSRQEL